MSKHRNHGPEFKAKSAMDTISGRKMIQEISVNNATHPVQVSQWKRLLLNGSSETLTSYMKSKYRP